MDLISAIAGNLQSFVSYAVPFLFVLTVIVFFHELGHFVVARWCGVAVETFSIGFGPEIWGFNDKKGTRWKLAWIPLGGYVKFAGDDNAASVPDREKLLEMSAEEREGNFHTKKLWQRAAVVAAGPIANFILAIVIFAFIYAAVGRQIILPRVDSIQADSAAAEAGFKVDDVIVSIGAKKIESFSDMQRIISTSADRQLEIVVDRSGASLTLLATPKRKEITDRFGNTYRIGLLGISRNAAKDEVKLVREDPLTAIRMGGEETYFMIVRTLEYLGDIIVGREDADQLGGPIRIAQVSGQVATLGFIALLNLAALLSVNIGLINLFPVPMLDGGHLMYYGIEALRGKPLSERVQDFGFKVGMTLVLMLMVFATWNDLVNLLVF
jgi:regulator of sigma E protease